MPLRRLTDARGFQQWWAVDHDGTLVEWKMDGDESDRDAARC